MVIGFDTNIFIYHFEKHPEFHKSADKALENLAKPKHLGITSVLTLIELLAFPQESSNIKNLQEALLTNPNLKIIDLNQEISLEAAKIRRTYGFRTSDAIQLATALLSKANKFVTNDRRLKQFKELKIQLLSS